MDSLEPIPSGLPETPVAPLPPPPRAGENPVFNLGDVALIVIVSVVAVFLSLMGAVIVFTATHPSHTGVKDLATNVFVVLPAQLAAYIATVGFMVALIWQKYRMRFLEAVSWNAPSARAAGGAVLLGLGLGLLNEVLPRLLERWIPKSLPIDELFRTPASAYAMMVFGILIAPLVEELFFRGFLYPALARPLGSVAAVGLTAALFALIHSEQLAHAWVPLLLLFGIGVVLTVVRVKTKSVAMCVIVHMSYNATLFTSLLVATCGFRHMDGCWG